MSSPAVHPYVLLALSRLARLFGHVWESEEELETYAETLDDLSAEDIDRACKAIAKVERRWPRPVVIRKAVQQLNRQRMQPLKPFAVPETWTNEDGVTEQLYKCRECQDQGVIPVTARENGLALSWDQVRGIGEFAGKAVPYVCVRICGYCQKFAKPTKRIVGRTFSGDDEPQPWRRD